MKMERSLAAAMNAAVVGSGEEVITLAHGFGGDQSYWDAVLPALSRRSRVLVFDWCFSGAVGDPTLFDPAADTSFDALADHLIRLIEELRLGPSVFVGHSMSGMIGCIAAVKRPDLFKKLVLVAASPRYLNTEGYEGGFDDSTVKEMISLMELDFQKWVSAFAASIGRAEADVRVVEKYEKSVRSMVPEVAVAVARTVFYGDNRAVLERVAVPCTVVQTVRDAAVPESVAHYMKAKLKGKAAVEMIDVAGHFPQLTAPDRLVSLIH